MPASSLRRSAISAKVVANGRTRATLGPGDYFGEVALAMDVPRTATVRTLTPVTLASCDRKTFDEYIRPLFVDDS